MDQFPDRQHVWLRSREHGTYLHADSDGHGVSLRAVRSMWPDWVVRRYDGEEQHVLLQNAAYGRFLAATPFPAPLACEGWHVELIDYHNLDVAMIRWLPIRTEDGDDIMLRHVDRGSLCVNWTYPGDGDYCLLQQTIASVGFPVNIPLTFWVVETLPPHPYPAVQTPAAPSHPDPLYRH